MYFFIICLILMFYVAILVFAPNTNLYSLNVQQSKGLIEKPNSSLANNTIANLNSTQSNMTSSDYLGYNYEYNFY
jgi:hypothetical protein